MEAFLLGAFLLGAFMLEAFLLGDLLPGVFLPEAFLLGALLPGAFLLVSLFVVLRQKQKKANFFGGNPPFSPWKKFQNPKKKLGVSIG